MWDWQAAALGGLTTVLDPMIVRTGHVFMAGPPADAGARGKLAALLSQENSAVRDFVDHVVLTERTPVFDYGNSYFRADSDEPAIVDDLAGISDKFGVGLVMAHVTGQAHFAASAAAMGELRRTFADRLQVADRIVDASQPGLGELLADIDREIDAFEYRWPVDLTALQLPSRHLDEHHRSVGLLYGERLFAEYAKALSGYHSVHTKRFELGLYFATNGSLGRDRISDPALLRKLAAEINASTGERVAAGATIPSFAGYLLSKDPRTVGHLIDSAVRLRDDSRVVRLRAAIEELRRSGDPRVASELAGSARGLRDWLYRRLRRGGRARVARAVMFTVASAGLGVAQLPAAPVLGASLGVAPLVADRACSYVAGPLADGRYRRFISQLRRASERWDEQAELVRLWNRS